MKDKRMSSKGKKNNKSNWSNRSNKKNKFNKFIPTQEQRIDKELLQEISVFINISPEIDDKVICNHYGITERQLQFIKKHQQKWDILDKITGKEV